MNDEVTETEIDPIEQIRTDWVTKFGRQKTGLEPRREKFDTVLFGTPVEPTNYDLSWKADLNRKIDELEAELKKATAFAEQQMGSIAEQAALVREQLDDIRRLNDLVGDQQDQIAQLEQQLADSPRVAALRTARDMISSSAVVGPFSSRPPVDPDHLIKVADWILSGSSWQSIIGRTFGINPDEGDDGGELLPVDELGYAQQAEPDGSFTETSNEPAGDDVQGPPKP